MDEALIQLLLLAVVQGATEFLPVSSSGHLVILGSLLESKNAQQLELSDIAIALHIGTLFSILVYYWRPVAQLLGEDRRTIGLLAVATLPAVFVGLPVKLFAAGAVLENPLLAGCMLLVTGAILICAARLPVGEKPYAKIGYRDAIVVGLGQAFAILPGISRSGTTIAAGMWLGLDPRSAATFSFLLAIPAIAGAGLVEIVLLAASDEPVSAAPLVWLAIAVFVSFLVGLAALWWLVRWVERGRLQVFAAWCIPVGVAVIVWQSWLLLSQ